MRLDSEDPAQKPDIVLQWKWQRWTGFDEVESGLFATNITDIWFGGNETLDKHAVVPHHR